MTKITCSVDGCENTPDAARGWCSKHYRRWSRHGSPTGATARVPAEERFFAKVDKTDGCWEWTGSKDRKGYGRFNASGGPEFAHRWAYRVLIGPLTPGLKVCHKCDNPACVNPDHLFQGSQGDNMRDAFRKGRLPGQKLTPADHAEIRARYTGASGQQKLLADEFGVSTWHISYLLNGHRWKRSPAT